MQSESQRLTEAVCSLLSLDYENVETLMKEVEEFTAEQGISLSEDAFKKELHRMIEEGYVEACLYDKDSNEFNSVPFAGEKINDYWFRVTAQGSRLVQE